MRAPPRAYWRVAAPAPERLPSAAAPPAADAPLPSWRRGLLGVGSLVGLVVAQDGLGGGRDVPLGAGPVPVQVPVSGDAQQPGLGGRHQAEAGDGPLLADLVAVEEFEGQRLALPRSPRRLLPVPGRRGCEALPATCRRRRRARTDRASACGSPPPEHGWARCPSTAARRGSSSPGRPPCRCPRSSGWRPGRRCRRCARRPRARRSPGPSAGPRT